VSLCGKNDQKTPRATEGKGGETVSMAGTKGLEKEGRKDLEKSEQTDPGDGGEIGTLKPKAE